MESTIIRLDALQGVFGYSFHNRWAKCSVSHTANIIHMDSTRPTAASIIDVPQHSMPNIIIIHVPRPYSMPNIKVGGGPTAWQMRGDVIISNGYCR